MGAAKGGGTGGKKEEGEKKEPVTGTGPAGLVVGERLWAIVGAQNTSKTKRKKRGKKRREGGERWPPEQGTG